MLDTDKNEKRDSVSENNDATTSVMIGGKPKPKSIKWSPENELIMVEWCDIAQCYKWLHMKCHSKLSYRHAWFTIPAIALSTISGTASFAQTSLPDYAQVYAPMVIGSINILIGISTTVQQYLKISELNESHRVSGISWDKFARNIRIELAKDPDERMDAGQFLKICRAEFDRLMETSPSIDEKTIKEFMLIFKGKETEDDRKLSEEQLRERFKELRKPDICNVIISSNESRHHWYKDPYRLRTFNQQIDDDLENGFSRMSNFDMDEPPHIQMLEKIKTQKQQEQKDRDELENLTREQTKLLNDYVSAFTEHMGRKPEKEEIVLNMRENVDERVLTVYLETYSQG